MTRRNRFTLAAGIVAIAIAAAGCETRQTKTTSAARSGAQPEISRGLGAPGANPLSNTDPCAMRLHDLCGELLLYMQAHVELPERLDQLEPIPGEPKVELTCPVTRTPYVYVPAGILIPERQSRIIIYDPTPAHQGFRWAVVMQDPKPSDPFGGEMKVIPLPERFFLLRPPG